MKINNYKVSVNITSVGLSQEELKEFAQKAEVEDSFHRIIIDGQKITFVATNLGFDIFIRLLLQFSLNNFPNGYHIHQPSDPSDDENKDELMIYKLKPNLETTNNFYIEGEFYNFIMPIDFGRVLINKIKKDLSNDKNNGDVAIDLLAAYPAPAIYATGLSFYKLAMIFFLFRQSQDLQSLQIFDNLELSKKK